MSLDLASTATQIGDMSLELKSRQGERETHLLRALSAVGRFSVDDYAQAGERNGDMSTWTGAGVLEAPSRRYPPPPAPADFAVVAADGSHIDADRHLPVRCFLINVGVSVLTYGSSPDAELSSQAQLYGREDELVIRDAASFREQAIEGAVLGAKRAAEEISGLVDAVRGLPPDLPALALLDGPLLVFGLDAPGNQDFVLRELIEAGYAQALEELRALAESRPLAVAGYTSLPSSAEVVSALRLVGCEYGDSDAQYRCGLRGPGRRPCASCIGGVLDREIFGRLLASGERSALFATLSRYMERYYKGNDVLFFYVNVGPEIGRVEVPSWVAEDEGALGLVHSLVLDQCRRGQGYPVGLMEAHEQAVVSGPDRRYFVELLERTLHGDGLPVYTSEKARSKRLRWL